MTTDAAGIKAMYEDLGHTPEEIALACGVDVTVVTAVLRGVSPKFSQTVAADVTDDEFEMVKNTVKDICRDPEAAAFLRLSAAKFLWNERKGRNDAKVGQMAQNINITVLQERLAEARGKSELKILPAAVI